jgi:hypothetical protein
MPAQDPGATPDDSGDFDALLEASSMGAPRVVAASEELTEEQHAALVKARAQRELHDLLEVVRPDGRQLRRIGELTEFLYDDDAARVWWYMAAAAGDQDAVDWVATLDEENPPGGDPVAEVRTLLLRLASPPPCAVCRHVREQHRDGGCILCGMFRATDPEHEYQPKES